MVAAELAQQTSLEAVAQSVVERVKRLHHDVYVSGRQRAAYCSRHEDMTLLIRTINYLLTDGALTPTQGKLERSSVLGADLQSEIYRRKLNTSVFISVLVNVQKSGRLCL